MRESCRVPTSRDCFSWGEFLLLCCVDSELFPSWTDHCSGYIYRALECRVRCKRSAVSPSGTCSRKRQVSLGVWPERCVRSLNIRILNSSPSVRRDEFIVWYERRRVKASSSFFFFFWKFLYLFCGYFATLLCYHITVATIFFFVWI